jgi:8-oxo-dGTP pyrophosphatase MutT (NUDIX family)/2'-5' RNA ligase
MREREDAFATLVDEAITRVTHKVVAKLGDDRVVVATGELRTAPIDITAANILPTMWQGAVYADISPALTDVYLQSAAVVHTGLVDSFAGLAIPSVSDSFAEDYLAAATNRLVGIGRTVWENIRAELLTGFSLGEGITKLRDRVVAAGQVSQARANVIARTEVNAAANAGAHSQVIMTGLTGTKEWLDTNDERTRCTHRAAGGQTVDVTGLFTLGGDECGTARCHLMFPGDPSGPPGEIIQCRCSVAYDLSFDETPLVAAAEVHTGAMIALLPSTDDAQQLALTGSYAEPANQLHVTLLYLGEAASWPEPERQLLRDVVKEIVEKYVTIPTSTFSVNIFNPGSDEFDTAVVLGVRGTDTLVALHDAITSNITDIFDDEVPEQHTPWVPHITLAYTDDMSVVGTAAQKLGPVTFDRVGVFFGGEVTEFPLGVQDEDDPVVATAQWKEAEHPRDNDGKFTKNPVGEIKKLAEGITHAVRDVHNLDAVPPSITTGSSTKFTNPNGVPGLLKLNPNPGKSGDGWTTKADGSPGPWGRFGAAGVLFRHRGEDGVDRYLVVQRGKGLDHAGKWQLPGGGLDSNETALEGTAREVVEELGFSAADVAKGRVHGTHEVTVPLKGGKEWKYTSVAATLPDQLVPDLSGENAQFETADAKWLTLDEIRQLDKDGGFLAPLAKGKLEQNIISLFPDTPNPSAGKSKVAESVVPAAPKVTGPEAGDFSGMKKISGPKGTNPGGIYEAPDGSRWYIKQQKSQAHAENEHLASVLYREAGIDVPEVIIGSGAPGITGTQTATRIVPNAKTDLPSHKNDQTYLAKLREGFAVDAWLGNYDAVGLVDDNIVTDQNGDPVRIDVGGSLEFRAQGKAKGALFGNDVVEWDALRDPHGSGSVLSPSQGAASKYFKGATPDQLSASVQRVANISPERIRELVKDKKLADKLIARREDLLKRAENEGVFDASASTGTDFSFIDEKALPDISLGDVKHPTAVVSPPPPPPPPPPPLPPLPSSTTIALNDDGSIAISQLGKWWDNLDDYEDGHVLATGFSHGADVRLVVHETGAGNKYIGEEYKSPNTGKWHSLDSYGSKFDFSTADLKGYSTDTSTSAAKKKLGPSLEAANLGMTDQELADMKAKVQFGTDVTPMSIDTVTPEKPADVWDKQNTLTDGTVVATGTTKKGHPLTISTHIADDGGPMLRELEQMPDGTWHVQREWYDKESFALTNLNDYPKFANAKKIITPSTATMAPPLSTSSTTSTVPPSAPPGSHQELWQRMLTGEFGDHQVVGEYTSASGYKHTLKVGAKGATPGFVHETVSPSGVKKVKEAFVTPEDFAAADLSLFKTLKVGAPPKPVAKLTNAVIYGKYNDGDVIATLSVPSGKPPERLVYKNNKIVTQQQNASGAWIDGSSYGKGEAYKKFSSMGPWFLGDAGSFDAGGKQLVTSVPTPKTPTPPPPPAVPTAAGISSWKKLSIKKEFDNNAVKWHTAAPTMLERLVATQKKFPELTLGQILAVMDGTTKTQTDSTPFTTKIKKYLDTKAGKQKIKDLGIPAADFVKAGTTTSTSTPGKSTPSVSTPSSYTGPFTVPAPTSGGHAIIDPGSHVYQAPPGGYKIHSNSEMTAIQEKMHKQHGAWTPTQEAALKKYTGNSYGEMNNCFRKPETCSPTTKKSNDSAAAGMKPLPTSIRVTRGVGWKAIPGADAIAKTDKDAAIKYIQQQEGRVLIEPAFVSTSSAATPAFGGPLKLIIDVPEGTPAAWVKNISHYKSENELLLSPGLKFRIKKVTPGTGSYYSPTEVHMEVIYP